MSPILVCYVLFLHFLADFVAQTHWQAHNKWNNLHALTAHVTTYSLVIWIGLTFFAPSFNALMAFAGITFVTHYATDFCTSKVTHYLFERKQTHNAFVVIGFDQLIHMVFLILCTARFLK